MFNAFIKTTTPPIKSHISDTISVFVKQTTHDLPLLAPVLQQFATSFEGGKYIRGALVLLGFALIKPKKQFIHYDIAAAVEILHTGFLIQDDVIDRSPTRRGKESVYKTLGFDHYALSQSVCLGDVAFFIANRLIIQSSLSYPNKEALHHYFTNIVLSTITGQMLDIQIPHQNLSVAEDIIMSIHAQKTAIYTITAPLTIGAILANAPEQNREAIQNFGTSLGIAYQLQDDIMGIFGDEKSIGKSVTSDISEGKNTLLYNYAYQNSSIKNRALLKKYYGKKNISKKQADFIRKLFIQSGSVNYSQQKLQKYVATARDMISLVTPNQTHQELLQSLCHFVENRKV